MLTDTIDSLKNTDFDSYMELIQQVIEQIKERKKAELPLSIEDINERMLSEIARIESAFINDQVVVQITFPVTEREKFEVYKMVTSCFSEGT